MTIRTLLNIILKVIGVFFIKEIINQIAGLAPLGYYFGREQPGDPILWALIITLIVIGFYVACAYVFIFKSDKVIERLDMDKGFEEHELKINIHRSTVLSISIILVGGVIIVQEVPLLIAHIYDYYRESKLSFGSEMPSYQLILLSAIKALIGFFLLFYHRTLVKFTEYKLRPGIDPRRNEE